MTFSTVQHSIAGNRFGLGLKRSANGLSDPRGYLNNQLKSAAASPISGVPSRAEIVSEIADFYEQNRAMRQAEMPDEKAAKEDRMRARREVGRSGRDDYTTMVGARFRSALAAEDDFVERLVHFWANHFAVSADKLGVVALAGLLEFEAIRPHVLGRFSDMLLAVLQHPAMLLYLDQVQSIGPNSTVGERIAARGRRKIGLNENLAREILELHTLGVRSVYAQEDVTDFARALTGWTVAGLARGPMAQIYGAALKPGDFAFVPQLHEPGNRRIIGRFYAQEGESQARAILSDLALHPATARHLSTKLARHFASDEPPETLVARLEKTFLATSGDLKALARVLIDSPECWASGQVKFKAPWEWAVSAYRATGVAAPADQQIAGLLTQLGQPIWRPKSPAGYDDVAASWAAPDALFRRVEVAERLARQAGSSLDARALALAILGGQMTQASAQAIARAESPGQGLALMLVAPEFLRR